MHNETLWAAKNKSPYSDHRNSDLLSVIAKAVTGLGEVFGIKTRYLTVFFFPFLFQTASFLGPMAQLCHRYSNLAHTVWVDLFPQLWNLLTDKQQQVSLELPRCLTSL